MSRSHTETKAMDAETLKALRGSIAKWESIVVGLAEDEGPQNCPLCLKFNAFVNPNVPRGCHGCPVRAKSGESGCKNTPYESYEDYMFDVGEGEIDEDAELAKRLAQDEVDFLKSLLPPESDDDRIMPMLPNDYHPGARCSCAECLEKFK